MIFNFERKRSIKHGVNDRTTEIRSKSLFKRTTLGKGHTVKEVFAKDFKYEARKGPEVRLAVKKYKYIDSATRAYKNYKRCREAGLPVPVTFGLDWKNMHTVYLTDLTMGGRFNVESKNNKIYSQAEIESITNISELAQTIAQISVHAAASRLNPLEDAFFFRFPKDGGSVPLDIIVGDYDNIHSLGDNSQSPQNLADAITLAQVILHTLKHWLLRRSGQYYISLDSTALKNTSLNEQFEELSAAVYKLLPEYDSVVGKSDKKPAAKHKDGVLYTPF